MFLVYFFGLRGLKLGLGIEEILGSFVVVLICSFFWIEGVWEKILGFVCRMYFVFYCFIFFRS